jgi:hypothetical protein
MEAGIHSDVHADTKIFIMPRCSEIKRDSPKGIRLV